MTRIKVLATPEAASRASQHILVSCQQVGLCCKTGHQGQVSLIAVSTAKEEVYVFDVKGDRDVLFDGEVCRILQSPDLLKVVHNGLDSIAALYRQHGILTQNVFDTQLAFSMVLESEGLPARRLPLSSLCENSCYPQYRPSPGLQRLLREDLDVWMRRPFTKDILNTIASYVAPLYPLLHRNLTRILHAREQLLRFEEINREDILSGIHQGKVQTPRRRKITDNDNERETNKYRNMNIKLTGKQRLMLSGMMPVIIKDNK